MHGATIRKNSKARILTGTRREKEAMIFQERDSVITEPAEKKILQINGSGLRCKEKVVIPN